ncbi:hypothetical protein ASF79_01880 [Agreia sp. Leaf335]|uniref:hypothetical protein n=1 Tax=Agreia sp. Leaf335 TaxID=1736340 RepID=UPI0006F5C200|nr:hypothetical protein [Agreia sp. Leaf335]KQR24012.1 hypothetical protein ASF79_01880 [Agreia sp. Leaf335]
MTFASVKRLLLVVAIVAVLVGSVAAVFLAAQPVSFGWFAYSPLSGDVFTPDGVHMVTNPIIYAVVILVFGLLAAAFWAGLTVGERRSRR